MMKRGFIDWNKREVGAEDFQKRKEKVVARMKEEGLHYLLVYGDVWQYDDVEYLSHFNTYTRDCLLVLNREGKMSLISSMTPRDREWIAGFTPVAAQDIFFAAGLTKGADVMKKEGFSSGKVGMAGDFFPTVLFDHLRKEFPEGDFVDLSEGYRGLRRVKDASEIRLTKRAALLATQAARALTDPGIFGKREADLSAQAEWLVRSRGGEDYHVSCASGAKGHFDFPKGREIRDWFAFSLLTQYKGCWTLLGRTSVSTEMEKKGKEDVRAYQGLVAAVQGEGAVDRLEKVIKEAEAQHWIVEIKSPVGPDTPSSVTPGLGRVPEQKDSVFSLTFQKEVGGVGFIYGETLSIGEEGYEVWTL